jgi:hypothetical protein
MCCACHHGIRAPIIYGHRQNSGAETQRADHECTVRLGSIGRIGEHRNTNGLGRSHAGFHAPRPIKEGGCHVCRMGPQHLTKWTRRPAACASGLGQQETLALQKRHHYSITSSAMASRLGGTVRPSALAVCRLITRSNLTARMTGRSAGFSPLRMRPAYTPTCRSRSRRSEA